MLIIVVIVIKVSKNKKFAEILDKQGNCGILNKTIVLFKKHIKSLFYQENIDAIFRWQKTHSKTNC